MKSLVPFTAVFFSALLALDVDAKTFDAVQQFSADSNTDTQTWSYRHSESGQRDGNYTLLPETFVSNDWLDENGVPVTLNGWSNPGGTYPLISANQSNSPLHRDFCCGDVFLARRKILIDAGPQLAVLSFLCPRGGQATVTFNITDIDCHGGDGITWYLDKNGGQPHSIAYGFIDTPTNDCLPSLYGTTGTITERGVSVRAGDRINFVIESGLDFTYDSTQIAATIEIRQTGRE